MYQATQHHLIGEPVIKKTHYRSGTHLFISFFWKNPVLLTGAIFLIIINSILTLLPAFIIGESLDILESDGYGSRFITFASIILIVAILNYVVSFTSNYVFGIVYNFMEIVDNLAVGFSSEPPKA